MFPISFILAVLAEFLVLIVCALTIGGNLMIATNDTVAKQLSGVAPIFFIGSAIAAMVAATHWLHMSW